MQAFCLLLEHYPSRLLALEQIRRIRTKNLLIIVLAVAQGYAQHLVWGTAKESAREDALVTAHPLAKNNAPVLVVKDVLVLALGFAQVDVEEPAEEIVLWVVKINARYSVKVPVRQPVKARVPPPVKAHVITPARRDVLQPAEIPASWYAQGPVLARVVPAAATDVPGRRHCSKSMVI